MAGTNVSGSSITGGMHDASTNRIHLCFHFGAYCVKLILKTVCLHRLIIILDEFILKAFQVLSHWIHVNRITACWRLEEPQRNMNARSTVTPWEPKTTEKKRLKSRDVLIQSG